MTSSTETLLLELHRKVDALGVGVSEVRHAVSSHNERMTMRGDQFSEILDAVRDIAARPAPLAPTAPVWNAQNVRLALVAVLVLALGNLSADGVRAVVEFAGHLFGWVK